uniref:Uncharacterized protein n=1 Tax=Manihot esculenta TaxID=3983 RepID=A0A2C9ULH8_MANES
MSLIVNDIVLLPLWMLLFRQYSRMKLSISHFNGCVYNLICYLMFCIIYLFILFYYLLCGFNSL